MQVLDAIDPASRAQLAAMTTQPTDIDVCLGTAQMALLEPTLTLDDTLAMRSALFPRMAQVCCLPASSAPIGSHWLRLALIGSDWLSLALIGSDWLQLALMGSDWAPLCSDWL